MTIFDYEIKEAKRQAELDSYTLQTELKRVEISLYRARVELLLSLSDQVKKGHCLSILESLNLLESTKGLKGGDKCMNSF